MGERDLNAVHMAVIPKGVNRGKAAKGYYLMFLVTQAGVPSDGKWVEIL